MMADDPGTDDVSVPLVVDLDGTLTPSDTLVESVFALLRSRVFALLLLPLALLRGRAALKAFVASQVRLNAALLPYRPDLLEFLRQQRRQGRRLVLATAAHRDIALAVSEHLGLFSDVIATDGDTNLKGATKRDAILRQVGPRYAYAGDSVADMPIWQSAASAILVGPGLRLKPMVSRHTRIAAEFPSAPAGLRVWLQAIRLHQWVKNVLLFVPMLTASVSSYLPLVGSVAAAFLSFSLLASATYLLNDLWDLDSDRSHPRKRRRPFASGAISPVHGALAAMAMGLCAFAIAVAVSPAFAAVLLLYLVLTLSYSLTLKRYVLIDVLMLATLYTLRIFAGAIVIGETTSPWLMAFSVFIFLSLALVKRCSELVSLQKAGATATTGRDYSIEDLVVLWPLGSASAMSSVVILGLFINAPETAARYAMPSLLWVTSLGLVYWLARLWIKCARGEMHDDPIVFAIRDRGCRITLGAMVVTTLVARLGLPI